MRQVKARHHPRRPRRVRADQQDPPGQHGRRRHRRLGRPPHQERRRPAHHLPRFHRRLHPHHRRPPRLPVRRHPRQALPRRQQARPPRRRLLRLERPRHQRRRTRSRPARRLRPARLPVLPLSAPASPAPSTTASATPPTSTSRASTPSSTTTATAGTTTSATGFLPTGQPDPTSGGVKFGAEIRRPVQDLGSIQLGGRHVISPLALRLGSRELRRPHPRQGLLRRHLQTRSHLQPQRHPVLQPSTTPIRSFPSSPPPQGVNIFDPTQYVYTGQRVNNYYNPEVDLGFGASLSPPTTPSAGHAGTFEFGGRFRNVHKFANQDTRYTVPARRRDDPALSMTNFLNGFTDPNYYGNHYTFGPTVDVRQGQRLHRLVTDNRTPIRTVPRPTRHRQQLQLHREGLRRLPDEQHQPQPLPHRRSASASRTPATRDAGTVPVDAPPVPRNGSYLDVLPSVSVRYGHHALDPASASSMAAASRDPTSPTSSPSPPSPPAASAPPPASATPTSRPSTPTTSTSSTSRISTPSASSRPASSTSASATPSSRSTPPSPTAPSRPSPRTPAAPTSTASRSPSSSTSPICPASSAASASPPTTATPPRRSPFPHRSCSPTAPST